MLGIAGIAAILSPPILFVYAKLRNTTTVPRDLASGRCPRRPRAVTVVMSMQKDHQVLDPETGALWPALWVGAAVVAMVAFSYWLNVM